MGLSVTVCSQFTYDLGCDPSRSSEVKSKSGFGLIGGGFLLVPLIVTMGLSVTVWPQFTSVTNRRYRLYDSNMQGRPSPLKPMTQLPPPSSHCPQLPRPYPLPTPAAKPGVRGFLPRKFFRFPHCSTRILGHSKVTKLICNIGVSCL